MTVNSIPVNKMTLYYISQYIVTVNEMPVDKMTMDFY
jgi:hypothetical protein